MEQLSNGILEPGCDPKVGSLAEFASNLLPNSRLISFRHIYIPFSAPSDFDY